MKITIKTEVGDVQVSTLKAMPNWAAHRTWAKNREKSNRWSVTHRQTGLAIATRIANSGTAKLVASALQDTFPFGDETAIRSNQRQIIELCKAYLMNNEMR